MSFLNAALLGGLAAALIPVVIHLLQRARFRRVPWGAMHLLEEVLRVNRRRVRLEQLLLLLLRIGLPVALALLMARPVLTAARRLAGAAPTSLTIALDDSYSLGARAGLHTAFEVALAECERIVQRLPPGSEIAVTLLGQAGAPPRETPTSDRAEALVLLRTTAPVHGPADPALALAHCARLLAHQHHSDRELVLVSDFQSADWSADAPALTEARARLRALPQPPRLTLLRIKSEPGDNVAVETLDPPALALGPGRPARFAATLRNHGDRSYPNLRVHLLVDGLVRATTEVALGARQAVAVSFQHTFDRPGTHPVEVRADADPLRADNARAVSVLVRDRLPVVVFDGEPHREPLRSETGFLQIALRPESVGPVGDTPGWIESAVVQHPAQFARALRTARVAILANVQRLAGSELVGLRKFLESGGGLLVFPGGRVDTEWYGGLFHDAGRGLLPMRLASLEGSLDAGRAPARVAPQSFTHPALEIFRGDVGTVSSGLGSLEVLLWYKLADDPLSSHPVQVLARLDNGDPLLVEKRVGAGRVVLCAIPADGDWSNLPMRPFYLPLVQRLVAYLAHAAEPDFNLDAGQPIVTRLVSAKADPPCSVTRPDGTRESMRPLVVGRAGSLEFGATRRPGIYTVSREGDQTRHYAVAVPARESGPARLDEAGLRALGRTLDAAVAWSGAEYAEIERARRHGWELWHLLLWLLLGALFAETLLLRRVHRAERPQAGRSIPASGAVPAR